MFSVNNTNPAMLQPARTVGSELPIRTVTLHLTVSNLKDVSGIPMVAQEDNERRKQLSSMKWPPSPQSHHDVPTPSARGPHLGCFHIQCMRRTNVKQPMTERRYYTCSKGNTGSNCITPRASPKGVWDVLEVHQPSPESCYPPVAGELNVQFDSAACLVFISWSLLRARASQEGSTCLPAF